MMKCIALGAVEFLRKPLSEDKLRNIWQHVVHKAFNAGGNELSQTLKPVKESVVSMLHLELENGKPENKDSEKTEDASMAHEDDREPSPGSDKYPAPSTPQIKQGGRLLDDGDCQDNTNCSTEKESMEQDGESKSVETTSGNAIAEVTASDGQPQGPRETETVVKEEADLVDGTKESTKYSHSQNRSHSKDSHAGAEKPNTVSSLSKVNRKKLKVDWTPELHKKFVQAVDQLGIDQAIPSRILELMKVEGLTRHNVASHLQVGDTFCPRRMTEDGHKEIKHKGVVFLINRSWPSLRIIRIMLFQSVQSIPCGEHLLIQLTSRCGARRVTPHGNQLKVGTGSHIQG
ncbi:hypothetical protein COLO4_17105 [Corchorus olitorius]|uniref:HTH myb-type domain-containing protein n=1 Tax=Corchorus olitorius TaxID=93759 RepID=A0A1R3JE85_9ROSI|nr:hypothetical protein COLO4_17105 [Corchorus olitorius]